MNVTLNLDEKQRWIFPSFEPKSCRDLAADVLT